MDEEGGKKGREWKGERVEDGGEKMGEWREKGERMEGRWKMTEEVTECN